jgi:hypothetical protein
MTVEELRRSVENHIAPEIRLPAFLDIARWVMARIAAYGDQRRGWSFDFTKGAFNTVAPYETGTITVTQSSTGVEGASTVWTGIAFTRQKLVAGGAHYPIASITDNDTLVLSEAYAGATTALLTYSIILDEYSLASLRRIHGMWEPSNDRRILGISRREMAQYSIELENGNDPYVFSIMGRNASTNVNIVQLAPYPTGILRIEYWYQADYTRITGIGDTIDMPSYMDEVIKQGALYRGMQIARVDGWEQQAMEFAGMMKEAWYLDQPQKEQKVRLMRSDRLDWDPRAYIGSRAEISV